MDTTLEFSARKANLKRIASVFWSREIISDEMFSDVIVRLLNAKTDDDLSGIATDIERVCKGKSYVIKCRNIKTEWKASNEGERGNVLVMFLAISVLFAGLAFAPISRWFLIPGAVGLCVLLRDCYLVGRGKEGVKP